MPKIRVNDSDSIRVIISGDSDLVWSLIDIRPEVAFIPDSAPNDTAIYHIHYQKPDGKFRFNNDSLCDLFGHLYKGWGQFGYINRNNSNKIDINKIININTQARKNLNDTSGYFGIIHQFNDTNSAVSKSSLQTSLNGISLYNPSDTNTVWQYMYANSANGRYEAISLNAVVGKNSMSNDGVRNSFIEKGYDINYYDSPIPVNDFDTTIGVRAIRKSSRSTQENVNFGGDIPLASDNNAPNISLGLSFAWGQNKTESDFLDLNGDGYPDVIGSKKIQYTMPWGGLGEAESIFDKYDDTDWHLSRNNTFTRSNSGGVSGRFPQMVKTNNSVNNSRYTLMANGCISNSKGNSECIQNYTDMNGDGLPDVIRIINDSTAYIAYNVGYSFTSPIECPWRLPTINKSESETFSVSGGGSLSNGTAIANLIGTKTSFFEQSLSLGTGRSNSTDASDIMLADVNGDGLIDIIQKNTSGNYDVRYNIGTEFTLTSYPLQNVVDKRVSQQTDFNASVTAGFTTALFKFGVSVHGGKDNSTTNTEKSLIDMDGDGMPDITTKTSTGVSVKYNKAKKANMLKRITNSTGSTIDIDYTLSDNDRNSPHRMWQMTSVTIKDTSAVEGDSAYHITYSYGKPYYDRMEREFYGYDTVIETHNGQKVVTSVYDNRHFLTNGNILEKRIADSADSVFLRQSFTYSYANRSNNMTEVADTGCCYCDDANLIMKRQCDETKYSEPYTSQNKNVVAEKCYEYDKYRNVIRYENNGDMAIGDDNLSANITYEIDTLHNMLSKVSQVVSSDGNSSRTTNYTYNSKGSLAEVSHSINGGFATKNYSYTQYGMVDSVVMPENDKHQRYAVTYGYDSIDHCHVTGTVDSYGYQSSTRYETKYWNPIETQGINAEKMQYRYDSIGRLTDIISPIEIANNDSFTIHYNYHPINHAHYRKGGFSRDSFRHSWVEALRFDVQNPGMPLRTIDIYDARGNKIQTKSTITTDNVTQKLVNDGVREKDCFGRVTAQYYPAISNAADYDYSDDKDSQYNPVRKTYDIMDRELITIFPDSTSLTNGYLIKQDKRSRLRLVTRTTDALGNTGETYVSPQEWTVQQSAALGTPDSSHTQLRYNAFGERVMAIDPDGAVTTYVYDGLGRLFERDHPDAGITLYTYDKAGNLTETRTERQHLYNDITTYTYDYNRQTGMQHHLSQDSVTIEYGVPDTHSAGLPVRIVNSTGVELMEYDRMGNVSALTQFVTLPRESDAIGFRTEWRYDSWNRLLDMTYNDRETVSYTYNVAGQLMKMAGDVSYIDDIQYDTFGNRIQMDYGNGVAQNYQYDNMLRLSNSQLSSGTEGQIKDLHYTYDAVGNILSQNNRKNALSNGLGGVYLQSYNYDAMNRLTNSSGGNNDAGVSYNFQQTYSPSGRIGGKTCDFTSQNDVFFYDASGYQMHALRKTIDGTTGVPCDFVYDENGNMQGYSVKEGAFVSYNIWDAANQMVATGNTRACGYYGYGSDGKRRYKLTGKTAIMSANAGDVVMDFSFGDYVLYPNSFLTGTPKGYTKHYYAGSERIASRLVNCWHNNKQVDSLLSVEKTNISTALQMSNSQFEFTFKERPAFMNYYSPDTVVDISGHSIVNEVKFPVLKLAGYFKPEDIVSYNYENLARNECKSELFFTHSDHLGSSSWTTDANGRAIQHIEYLPFGEELVNQRTTSYGERYTFTGKELDAESNLYYYDARYNSSTYSQFIAIDPMSDKYPAVNPYLYCAGNPVIYVDPDGTHPLFDTGGNFLGVDDEGFQGKAIIMNKDDFPEDPAVLLTSENALKLSKGYQSLSTNEAKKNFAKNYNDMKKRPDYDGVITVDEANDWYRNGNGKPLFADFSKLKLPSNIDKSKIDKDGTVVRLITSIPNVLDNFFHNQKLYNQQAVYGSITLTKVNGIIACKPDCYDFKMHKSNSIYEAKRNLLTLGGLANAGFFGSPYNILFYGHQK